MTDRGLLVATLERLAMQLGAVSLRLAGPEAEGRRVAARRLAGEYLAPRLAMLRGPLVVAVVGPSGSGKSTLVNSLAGAEVSPAGLLRPTTGRPVVWSGDAVPGTVDGLLGRLEGRLVDAGPPPPDGTVLVDTPPPGVGEAASQAIAVADACIVVVTGLRYADVVAWDLIHEAAVRRLPTIYVLNRLPEATEAQRPVVEDFTGRLTSEGLVGLQEPVIVVAEGPSGTSGLPGEWVAGLRKDLEALGGTEQRARMMRHVTGASLVRLRGLIDSVRSDLVDAAVERHRLLDPARLQYRAAADELAADVVAGEFADLANQDRDALAADLAAVVTRRAGRAARAAATVWEAHAAGRSLLSEAPGLWSHGSQAVADARDRCVDWYGALEEAVSPVAGRWRRRRRARALAAALAAAALDPQLRPGGRRARRLDLIPGALATARHDLIASLRQALEVDSGRFLAAVGTGPPPGTLSRLSVDPEEWGG
jgi:energy-coupling factor transporter ATP-binding protein EcfA2